MVSERDEVVRAFDEAVNLTPARLRRWLETEESQSVGWSDDGGESVGHESGRRIVAILSKHKADLDDDDLAQMRRTVAYVRRHLAQRPEKEEIATSRWRYSLMNWGHDPLADG